MTELSVLRQRVSPKNGWPAVGIQTVCEITDFDSARETVKADPLAKRNIVTDKFKKKQKQKTKQNKTNKQTKTVVKKSEDLYYTLQYTCIKHSITNDNFISAFVLRQVKSPSL